MPAHRMYEWSFQRGIVNKNPTGSLQRKGSNNNKKMAVTPLSFTKSMAVWGEVVPRENHMNLELRGTENPSLSLIWGHCSYELIVRAPPMVPSSSPGSVFPVGLLLFLWHTGDTPCRKSASLKSQKSLWGEWSFRKDCMINLIMLLKGERPSVASLPPNPSPASIWFRTNVLKFRYFFPCLCVQECPQDVDRSLEKLRHSFWGHCWASSWEPWGYPVKTRQPWRTALVNDNEECCHLCWRRAGWCGLVQPFLLGLGDHQSVKDSSEDVCLCSCVWL